MRRAEAAGEKDWEKRLKQMNHNLTSRAANKKLSIVSKGSLKTFDKIQVPTHDWFYSAKSNELIQHEDGNFLAHASDGKGRFHEHHTLKVMPSDAVKVLVESSAEGPFSITQKFNWFLSTDGNKLFETDGTEVRTYEARAGKFLAGEKSPVPPEATTVEVNLASEGISVVKDFDII